MVGNIIEKYLFADLALDLGLYKLVSGDIKVLTSYTQILTDIYNTDWNLSQENSLNDICKSTEKSNAEACKVNN